MSVSATIISQFKQVAQEQGKRLLPLTEDLLLLDSGIDSLCLAIIVARLEHELGIDPFSADATEDARFPITLGDFIRSYEAAA